MTLFAKSTLSAVAAAIAAAAVLATTAIPAQAEFTRAPARIIKPGMIKKPMTMMMKVYVLKCLKSAGDVVGQPLVINTTGKILPIGRKIQWKATMANGSVRTGTHTLKTPFYAGQSRRIPATLHWNFTCKATVFA